MIRQMSANHLCAQRAYTFLQQLLELLDKTLPDEQQRLPSQADRSSTPPLMGDAAMTGSNNNWPEEAIGPDLWSFWGTTQDLTTDLGSQLQLHSTLGSAMWSWDSQDPGEPVVLASSPTGGVMPC